MLSTPFLCNKTNTLMNTDSQLVVINGREVGEGQDRRRVLKGQE